MTIKYRYALDQRGHLVDASTLRRSSLDGGLTYRCASCGGSLIAKLGDIKAKHFAHKSLTENCPYETYLHRLAKSAFYSEYLNCLEIGEPFYLIRHTTAICNFLGETHRYACSRVEERHYDLTKYFDKVHVEKAHRGFVADVLLESSTSRNVLFVEFAVTHRCDEEKIDSGIRIIEYCISGDDQLGPISSHVLCDDDHALHLYNFRKSIERRPNCNGECDVKVNVFVVYKSKQCVLLKNLLPRAAIDLRSRANVLYTEVLGPSESEELNLPQLFRQTVREAHFKKIPVKNCFLCRYHGQDGIENAVFCKLDKQSVSSNQAAVCIKYRPMATMQHCVDKDRANDEYALKSAIRNMFKGPNIK